MNIAPKHLVRAADADLLDTFLVSAIATVVIIRIFLEATGYPQLGGGGLHIAHVLWGGLGMLVAIALLLLFLSPTTRQLSCRRAVPGPVRAPARDGLRRWPDLRGDRFEPLVSPDPGRDLHPRWHRVRPDRGLHGRSPRWGLLRRLGCTDRVGRGDERRDDRIGDPGDRGARGGCPDRERGVPAPTVPGQGLPRLRARDPGGSPFGAAVRIPRRRFRRGHRRLHRLGAP